MLFRSIYFSQAGLAGTGSISGGITQIDGNTGSAFGPTVTITTGSSNAQGTSKFTGDGVSTLTQTFTSTDGNFNTGLGTNVLNSLTTGTNSTCFGYNSGTAVTSAVNTTGFGWGALQTLATGNFNVAVGAASLLNLNGGSQNVAVGTNAGDQMTTGSDNTCLGQSAGAAFTTGSNNSCIGSQAGSSSTGASSSNIYIQNVGAVESNTTRIGTQGAGAGQQNRAFMAGIVGTSITSPANVVIDPSTGQLGVGVGEAKWEFIVANQTLEVNKKYAVTAGALSLALPTTSAQGDQITILLAGGTSWTLTQAAGQSVHLGNLSTTVGVVGSIATTGDGDAINLVCTTANLTWYAYSGGQGNPTVT